MARSLRIAALALILAALAVVPAGTDLRAHSPEGATPTAPTVIAEGTAQAVAETPAAAAPRTQTPTPPCENGTAVPSPATNPGLVADCAILLAAKDTLRGTATLNWSADRAITAWSGVTVASLPYGAPQRVTQLVLRSGSLNGSIPAALGDLSALRELRLQWNQLTGSIPAALGNLGQLTYLGLGGNRLTGAIPPELGAIGGTLRTLHLTGPNPLPSGIGLTGAIPPALGNLTGLQSLYLNGNRLTGPIPTRLRWLTELQGLFLNRNQLTGAIPTQLGALTNLAELRLESNQLTGAIPTQLGDLRNLRKAYLKNNSGLSGCVPSGLLDVRFNDVSQLNLPMCPTGTPPTPMTPLPTFTLTVTATGGGSVEPGGATTHDEDAEVTLTASWNDATHTFTGWGGDCGGTALTCVLTMLADKSVTATFAALPADRCATTTAADCIRAVYKGAPDDYAQVQEMPVDRLLTPGSDGRYQVERGWQITVVTAARLPTGYTRFYLQRRPTDPAGTPAPVSAGQLIQPLGTTYTFTVTTDEAGRTLFTFDLQAAKPPLRPGLKPQLGNRVVTTTFQVTTTTIRYTSYDTTGAATTQGSYAFLTGSGDDETAVTTYEALRDGTATGLRIHQSDGYGASQADTYGAVAVGDVFEWREADDCWVRYEVTDVKADPAGTAPRKEFAVKWKAYAFTGCSGTVATDTHVSVTVDPPVNLLATAITVPVRYGPYQLIPFGWSGTVEEETMITTASSQDSATSGASADSEAPAWPSDDPTVARQHPLWAEPSVPTGWQLGGLFADATYVEAIYADSDGYFAARFWIYRVDWLPRDTTTGHYRPPHAGEEVRTIDGHPAIVKYSRAGSSVHIFNETTGVEYFVHLYSSSEDPDGRDIEDAIVIARSLYQ